MAASLAAILMVRGSMNAETFLLWGWRLPFLVSIFLIAVAVYIRMQLTESIMFLKAKERGETVKVAQSIFSQLESYFSFCFNFQESILHFCWTLWFYHEQRSSLLRVCLLSIEFYVSNLEVQLAPCMYII